MPPLLGFRPEVEGTCDALPGSTAEPASGGHGLAGPCPRWASIAFVSRILWVGVGAASGIYVYRKTTQTIEGVRERTVRENLTRIAKHASNVAASARYLAALNADEEQPEGVVDIRKAAGGR